MDTRSIVLVLPKLFTTLHRALYTTLYLLIMLMCVGVHMCIHPPLHLQIPDEQGGCRMFYNTSSASCTFKVEEFGM